MNSCSEALAPTVVQVAEVSSVEEEVSSEEVSEAPPAWPEGQGGVEVEASCPVGLSSQEVTCGTSNNSAPAVKQAFQTLPGCLATKPSQECAVPSLCGPKLYMLKPLMLVGPPR